MKAMIYCPEKEIQWVKEYFADIVPYLLPVANKPYLEYLIEFCVLHGVKQIKVISDMAEQHFEKHCGKGARWGVDLSYDVISPDVDIAGALQRNMGALGEDDLLVLSGMFWLDYDQRNFKKLPMDSDRAVAYGSSCYLIGRNRNNEHLAAADMERLDASDAGIRPLASIRDFFDRSMEMARGGAAGYTMTSYNSTPGIYIGQDVSIGRTARIEDKVIIGNVVQIGEHTQIGPATVLGNNTFIDDHTAVADSVVMDNSYVGCYLELVDKIVCRNVIIDPETGVKMDIMDNFVLKPIFAEKRKRTYFLQKLAALVLWLVQLIPFLLLRPLISIRSEDAECYLSADHTMRFKIKLYIQPAQSWSGRWFRKLSLDRFHLLPKVLHGEICLVGNLLLPVKQENLHFLKQFPDYLPGLFSYSEMLHHEKDQVQLEMDELYYIYHAGFSLNWLIFWKTLLRNLLKAT